MIAVGVESKQEKNTLIELGVHGYQGRFFSEENQIIPVPQLESVVKLGRRNRWRKSK